ncbi:MAG: hypothetical protein MJ219_04475 [Mycoplasmoidaceae bacterium]|nr:hypothetical protein [Mycoplasmoidaceae bacterium]
MLVYGAAIASSGQESVNVGIAFGFVFASLFASLLLPLIPYAISLVISVPFMFLVSYLSNKHIAKLVIFILGFIIVLTLYSLILRFMAD